MKHKKLNLTTLLLLCLGLSGMKAQQTIPATGGNATGSGGTASYTVGQVFYTTSTGTSGTVAQGVQQPIEISVVSGIDESTGINLACTVYPNPTADYLTLRIEGEVQPQYIAALYDINGKLLYRVKTIGNETTIPLVNFVPAVYFLKVANDTKIVKTFKIIKQ